MCGQSKGSKEGWLGVRRAERQITVVLSIEGVDQEVGVEAGESWRADMDYGNRHTTFPKFCFITLSGGAVRMGVFCPWMSTVHAQKLMAHNSLLKSGLIAM